MNKQEQFLNPDYSNQIIDLYLNEKESTKAVKYYDITLHQNMHKIGFIRVYLRVFNRRLGNIGYVLQEEYQGNPYILQALELLREPMLHYGLNKIMITASPDNYASIQTIENFGGKLISGIVEGYHYNTYEVSLEEENKNSKIKIQKRHFDSCQRMSFF